MAVISSPTKTVSDPPFPAAIARVERTLRADGAVSIVLAPTAGDRRAERGRRVLSRFVSVRPSPRASRRCCL
jgi:hypothetical protein